MYGNAEYHVRCRENLVNELGVGQTFHFEKLWIFWYKAEKHETTCILHESFLSILENDLMVVRPDLQCESPLFSRVMVFLPYRMEWNTTMQLTNVMNMNPTYLRTKSTTHQFHCNWWVIQVESNSPIT
jgi:hypothetical protein